MSFSISFILCAEPEEKKGEKKKKEKEEKKTKRVSTGKLLLPLPRLSALFRIFRIYMNQFRPFLLPISRRRRRSAR